MGSTYLWRQVCVWPLLFLLVGVTSCSSETTVSGNDPLDFQWSPADLQTDLGETAECSGSPVPACFPCQESCQCAAGVSCMDGICVPESPAQAGTPCLCSAQCTSGLSCISQECTSPGGSPQPEILSFTAAPPWGPAPLSTSFQWDVIPAISEEVSCRILLDEQQVMFLESCPAWGTHPALLAEPGRHSVVFELTGSNGESQVRTLSVYANVVEYASNVHFPDEHPDFLGAGIDESTVTLMYGGEGASTVEIGDLVWLRSPVLLIRVVDIVDYQPGKVVLETEPALFTDAVTNCRFGASPAAGAPVDSGTAKVGPGLETALFPVEEEEWRISTEIEEVLGDFGALQAVLIFEVDFYIKDAYIDAGLDGIKALELHLEETVFVGFKLKGKAEVKLIDESYVLGEQILGVLGVFPVFFTISDTLSIDVEFTPLAVAAAVMQAGLEFHGEVYIKSDENGNVADSQMELKPVIKLFGLSPEEGLDLNKIDVKLSFLHIKAGPCLKFLVKLYGLLGPFTGVCGYAESEAILDWRDKKLCHEIGGGVEGVVGIAAGFGPVGAEWSESIPIADIKTSTECVELGDLAEALGLPCGDGICDWVETACSCDSDCQPACGDGCCAAEEQCDCVFDCSGHCGNGMCDCQEDSQSCPADCGNEEWCGNGNCAAVESCAACPEDCGDCCGNGSCEEALGETCETCVEDCKCDCPSNWCQDHGHSSGSYCEDNDTVIVCAEDPATDCPAVDDQYNCSSPDWCEDGNCQSPQCDNECSQGQSQCSGETQEKVCVEADGCWEWSVESCAGDEICTAGSCTPCGGSGQVCCDGNQCDGNLQCQAGKCKSVSNCSSVVWSGDLDASPGGAGEVALSWSDAPGNLSECVDQYAVLRMVGSAPPPGGYSLPCTPSTLTSCRACQTSGTSCTDSNAPSGQLFAYCLYAVKSGAIKGGCQSMDTATAP